MDGRTQISIIWWIFEVSRPVPSHPVLLAQWPRFLVVIGAIFLCVGGGGTCLLSSMIPYTTTTTTTTNTISTTTTATKPSIQAETSYLY